jgi:hypothetical protein
MVRKYFVSFVVAAFLSVCLAPTNSSAYLSNIQVLEKKDIVKLSDDSLTATYLDLIIEIEAIVASHMVVIYMPKEYQQYKDFLRYRYELKSELQHRQLEIPTIKDERP